jgi:hypothetical protein
MNIIAQSMHIRDIFENLVAIARLVSSPETPQLNISNSTQARLTRHCHPALKRQREHAARQLDGGTSDSSRGVRLSCCLGAPTRDPILGADIAGRRKVHIFEAPLASYRPRASLFAGGLQAGGRSVGPHRLVHGGAGGGGYHRDTRRRLKETNRLQAIRTNSRLQ